MAKVKMMATIRILEGARSFRTAESVDRDITEIERRYWRWPAWPARQGARPKDDYLIAISLRRRPLS